MPNYPKKKAAKKQVKPKISELREKYLKTLTTLKKCEMDFIKFFPNKEINHSINDIEMIANLSFSSTPQSDEIIITIKTEAGAYFNFSFEKEMARYLTSDILTSIEQDEYLANTSDDEDDEEENSIDDNRSLEEIIKELEDELGVTEDETKSEDDNEDDDEPKKYTILATRNLETAWTYTVVAKDEDEALEMVENCPDGYCDEVTHNDDENVYSDEIEYTVNDVQPIEKPKAKKAVPKKKK